MIARNAKYPMLSTIANILSSGGWVLAVIGAIVFLYGLFKGVLIIRILSGIVVVVLGLVVTAAGELIGVLFDIEQNTRTASTAGRAPEPSPHR